MNNRYVIIFALASVLALSSCGGQRGADRGDLSTRKINAVATTGMIGDAIKKVGGERVSVIALMGPGVDPHLYKASEGDVTRMADADIIFYNGLHLEGKMAEIFERMQSLIPTVAVAEGVNASRLEKTPEFSGNYDPHIWFDVSLWMGAVTHVREALAKLDPANAKIYQQNAEAYLAKLKGLDVYVKAQAETVPIELRVLVTAHDAFHYFGKAYGFEVRGLQGISTATETGTADVQNLADFIVARRIPAMFVETSVPPRFIEALQAAVQNKGFDVKIGGNLFSDAMGNPGTPEGEYTGMVRHNIDTIAKALSKTSK